MGQAREDSGRVCVHPRAAWARLLAWPILPWGGTRGPRSVQATKGGIGLANSQWLSHPGQQQGRDSGLWNLPASQGAQSSGETVPTHPVPGGREGVGGWRRMAVYRMASERAGERPVIHAEWGPSGTHGGAPRNLRSSQERGLQEWAAGTGTGSWVLQPSHFSHLAEPL